MHFHYKYFFSINPSNLNCWNSSTEFVVGGYSGLYRVSVDATKAIQRADVRRCAAPESCRSCDISDGGRVLAAVGSQCGMKITEIPSTLKKLRE